MDHFSWLVSQIDSLMALDDAHARSVLRDLAGALGALEGTGPAHTVFGMVSGSLAITTEQRGYAIARVKRALVAKRDAFRSAGDVVLLREMSALAGPCRMPELRSVPMTHHPGAPWLRDWQSGIAVLEQCSKSGFDDVISWFFHIYRGPAFGGLDAMPPNSAAKAWLLIGRWADCLDDDVQEAALSFVEALRSAVSAVDDGTTLRKDAAGGAVLSTTRKPDTAVVLSPWHAYRGAVRLRADPARHFASLPGWVGLHMGAPHWLGRGVDQRNGDIHSSRSPRPRAGRVKGDQIMCLPHASDRFGARGRGRLLCEGLPGAIPETADVEDVIHIAAVGRSSVVGGVDDKRVLNGQHCAVLDRRWTRYTSTPFRSEPRDSRIAPSKRARENADTLPRPIQILERRGRTVR